MIFKSLTISSADLYVTGGMNRGVEEGCCWFLAALLLCSVLGWYRCCETMLRLAAITKLLLQQQPAMIPDMSTADSLDAYMTFTKEINF